MGVWAQGDTSAVVDSENQPEIDSEDLISGSASGEYELIPFVQFDELQGEQAYDTQDLIPFGSPRYANTAYPEPVTDPTSSTATIGSYFFNWNVWTFNPVLSAQQNVQNQAKNIDLILRQSKNSFSALVSNQASMASQINKIITTVDVHSSDIQSVWGSIGVLDRRSSATDTALTAVKKNVSSIDGKANKNANDIQSVWGSIGVLDGKAIKNANDIQSIWSGVGTLDDSLTALKIKVSGVDDKAIKNATDIQSVWGSIGVLEGKTTTNAKDIQSNSNGLGVLDNALTAVKIKVSDVDDKAIKNANDIQSVWGSVGTLDNRLQKIESFDFASIIDLTILVTAINSVGSKVQDLIDVFDVTDPKPNSFAFFFQSLIRSQTLAIVDALAMVDKSLNDNFVNYFSDSKNGQFWTAYKDFSDFQMAVFFGVFFESLQEDWEANWLTVLDVWNTTNSFLATIAGWLDQIQVGVADSKEILAIITNWLKLIYEKPVSSFNVPAFDYVRLENMLKKLEFGEVVNEAGTNIWDFLTSLVDNLGDLIETQIKEFTKVLSEILDFLDGLIDKMIGLVVPKNLDFMRQGFDDVNLKFKAKFGNFLNISASITQMFQPIEKDFISELSFDFMGVPFVPDITILAAFVPKFRNVVALLMWFNVGWWAFRRFTGTGDVVNDN